MANHSRPEGKAMRRLTRCTRYPRSRGAAEQGWARPGATVAKLPPWGQFVSGYMSLAKGRFADGRTRARQTVQVRMAAASTTAARLTPDRQSQAVPTIAQGHATNPSARCRGRPDGIGGRENGSQEFKIAPHRGADFMSTPGSHRRPPPDADRYPLTPIEAAPTAARRRRRRQAHSLPGRLEAAPKLANGMPRIQRLRSRMGWYDAGIGGRIRGKPGTCTCPTVGQFTRRYRSAFHAARRRLVRMSPAPLGDHRGTGYAGPLGVPPVGAPVRGEAPMALSGGIRFLHPPLLQTSLPLHPTQEVLMATHSRTAAAGSKPPATPFPASPGFALQRRL